MYERMFISENKTHLNFQASMLPKGMTKNGENTVGAIYLHSEIILLVHRGDFR